MHKKYLDVWGQVKAQCGQFLCCYCSADFHISANVDYCYVERGGEKIWGVSWKFPLYFAYSVLFEQYIRQRAVLAAVAVPKPPPLVFVFSMVGSCHHKGGGLVGLLVLVLLLLLLSYHKSPRLCWYAAQWIDMQGWWCVVCGTRDGIYYITGLSIQNPAYVNIIQGKSVNNKFYTG